MIRSSELFWVELDNDRSARPWTQGLWLHNQRWRRGRPRRVRVCLGQAKAQSRTRTRFGSDGECWTDTMLYGGLVVVALIRLMMRQRRAETSHYSSEGWAGRMQAQTGCVGPGQSRTGHPAHLIQGWTWDWVHSFKMVVRQSRSSCVYLFCLSTIISQVSWEIVKEKNNNNKSNLLTATTLNDARTLASAASAILQWFWNHIPPPSHQIFSPPGQVVIICFFPHLIHKTPKSGGLSSRNKNYILLTWKSNLESNYSYLQGLFSDCCSFKKRYCFQRQCHIHNL